MTVWALISPRQIDREHAQRHYFGSVSRSTFTASEGADRALVDLSEASSPRSRPFLFFAESVSTDPA